MAKTYMDADMDAELEGIEDSDEEAEKMDEDEKEESSDDELEDNDELDEADLKKVAELEAELSGNPYNYEAHSNLLALLKKGSDFNKIREARERFSKYYPLSPTLWIEWTKDEMKIAATPEDNKMIVDLFERGVKDYVSVDLWLEYGQFGLSGIGTQEGIATARSVYERSLTAVGLHAGKGALLWESYREFETALLSLKGTPTTEEQTKLYNQQKERIVTLFRRQLRVPHLDMEGTFAEYKEFVGGEVDPNIERDYNKAREKLKLIEQFEISLSTETPDMESYKQYLQFELKEKDPTRIQLLYERALTDHCLDGDVWLEYLNYIDSNLKIDTVSIPVYQRAVRNCPWSAAIWSNYITALERFEKDHKEVVKVFEESLEVGFNDPTAYLEVWLAFVDYSRRRTDFEDEETEAMQELRKIFNQACDHLASVGGDPECEMLKYFANIEAEGFKSTENGRKLWADILQVHQFKGSVWMEAITFEKIFGDKKHLRKRYERAMEKTHDTPELIAASWTQFEREEGSLQAFDTCRKAIRLKMDKVEASRSKAKVVEEEQQTAFSAKVEKKKEKDKQHRRDKRHQQQATKAEKLKESHEPFTKANKTQQDPSQTNGSGDFKVPQLPGTVPSPAKQTVAPPPGFPGNKSVAPPPGFPGPKTVAPPPGFPGPARDNSDSTQPAAKRARLEPGATSNGAPSTDAIAGLSEEEIKKMKTVFLSNLDFDVNETEISSILGSSGTIAEVRLVKHPNGKSKGYAFVEFSNYEEAQAALARDNELVKGRPMYISECDPEKKKGPVFKYNTGLEQRKLFVRGLDFSVTKSDLAELFSTYGELEDVRLVTYRNGHSKGIAFVEFKEEVAAAKALVKTDGMKVKDKEIHVAISNPPKKKDDSGDNSSSSSRPQTSEVRSLGGTTQKEFGPRGKGRSQVGFMPRSLAVGMPSKPDIKLQPMKFVKPASVSATAGETGKKNGASGNTTSENGNTTADTPAKSNSDFRKMLLGSK